MIVSSATMVAGIDKTRWPLYGLLLLCGLASGQVLTMTTGVLLEIGNPACSEFTTASQVTRGLNVVGFKLDQDYQPVVMKAGPREARNCTVIVHGWVDSLAVFEHLRAQAEVVEAWLDTPIAPMPKQE